MDRIHFLVNNVPCSVGSEVDSQMSLNVYLREKLHLYGTKYMCREGGCGACIVTVTKPHPTTAKPVTFAVNSCLVSITSCEGWEITTVEGIGNKLKGYHQVQKTLAENNGTQCGYCTPGWVMSMYSLLQSKKGLNKAQIENSFGSNVCRCTGYRPILDAFKTFASDKNENIADIEDLKICDKDKCDGTQNENGWCFVNREDVAAVTKSIQLKDGKKWIKVSTVRDIFTVLSEQGTKSYMLVGGNTAKGAYPIAEYPDVLIDISTVAELKSYKMDQNLILAAGTTLTEMMDIFQNVAANQDYFGYLQTLYEHVDLVAHIPVRNIGTIAGNLMTKHKHHDFPSDLFLLFETVGAELTIENEKGVRSSTTLEAFLALNMDKQVIINVILPPLSSEYNLATFKVMKHSQNAHAIVNAGFMYKISKNDKKVSEARIVYGGLSPKFIRAKKTEALLIGKQPFKNDTLQEALKELDTELIVDDMPPQPSAESRKKIALGLFYKGLLKLCPDGVLSEKYKSGAENLRLTRPVSKGKQVFDTNPDLWPLNQPIPKVEALIQCSGEAQYVNDIPTVPEELHAAFVLSKICKGVIKNIDASEALKIKGVVAFYSAKDIPGLNSFTSLSLIPFNTFPEEVLCSGIVQYYNQPIGVIVAETDYLAQRASEMVKVEYVKSDLIKPVLTISEAKTDLTRTKIIATLPATDRGLFVTKIINNTNNIYGQYHFTMELQTCLTIPTDYGIEVHSATQWLDAVQVAISEALKIDENSINMKIRRIGGAYGAKISRSSQVAVACSLVTHNLNKPCRFVVPLTTTMRAIGKRCPCSSDFEVGVDDDGKIQYLILSLYEDNGYMINEPFGILGLSAFSNCYDKKRFNFTLLDVTTDTHSNTWCRAPGTLEQIVSIEYIMEQISCELSLDPISVRLANLDPEYDVIKEMTETLKENADYDKRLEDVKKFNSENRWKKRGLRYTPLTWPLPFLVYYSVTLSVYHNDGTVAITHGGVEMGQGINTKAVQVCAYTLKIPVSKVKIKPTNVISNANSTVSGGSFASEAVCLGVIKCCNIIQERLNPLKATLGDTTWEALVAAAFKAGVNLVANYAVKMEDVHEYKVHAVTFVEVLLDILTGDMEVLRVDLLEDVGQSLNPKIDVGQIEGAFIMGLGYWTSEELVYDKATGEMLTNRTWEYHVPQAKDIPIDFRVYFKRNSYNQLGVLGSKATGEPATCSSVVIAFALRAAIAASRGDSGYSASEWFHFDGPFTTAKMVLAADAKLSEFKFNDEAHEAI